MEGLVQAQVVIPRAPVYEQSGRDKLRPVRARNSLVSRHSSQHTKVNPSDAAWCQGFGHGRRS